MLKILVATANPHKASEIAAILPEIKARYLTLKDFPEIQMPPENGKTLHENAMIKARAAASASGIWTLADDTGLEVDYLNGAPGVYSARYAGEERNYEKNNKKLLQELIGVPEQERTARFRCVVALCSPAGMAITEEGVLEGSIGIAGRGTNGFGYDPIFIVKNTGKTLAEIDFAEKNSLSHRYHAIREMEPHLKRLAEEN